MERIDLGTHDMLMAYIDRISSEPSQSLVNVTSTTSTSS